MKRIAAVLVSALLCVQPVYAMQVREPILYTDTREEAGTKEGSGKQEEAGTKEESKAQEGAGTKEDSNTQKRSGKQKISNIQDESAPQEDIDTQGEAEAAKEKDQEEGKEQTEGEKQEEGEKREEEEKQTEAEGRQEDSAQGENGGQNESMEQSESGSKGGVEVSAPSAILMESSTGQVIYEKDADTQRPPASVTKVMTLLLIFDALDDGKIKLEDEVTTSEYAASMGGSQVFLEPGEVQTVDTLIKCISVASANDACVAFNFSRRLYEIMVLADIESTMPSFITTFTSRLRIQWLTSYPKFSGLRHAISRILMICSSETMYP